MGEKHHTKWIRLYPWLTPVRFQYGVCLGSETGFLIPLSLTESAPKLLRFVCDLLHKKIALVRSKTLIFSDQNIIIPRTSRQY